MPSTWTSMNGDPVHEWLQSLVDSVTHPVEENPRGRVKNPRVMRANTIDKEDDEGSLMGWKKRLGGHDYAGRDIWIESMNGIPIHRTRPPIHVTSPIHESGLPHPKIFHFERSNKIKRYTMLLICLFHPSQYFPVIFSIPYFWLHPSRGFFSTHRFSYARRVTGSTSDGNNT